MDEHMDQDFKRWNEMYSDPDGDLHIHLSETVKAIIELSHHPDRTYRRIQMERVLMTFGDELQNRRKVLS